MKRREFITLLGGAAAAWPLAARAQQGGRVRRIGVLMSQAADDPEGLRRVSAFAQGLQEHGWSIAGTFGSTTDGEQAISTGFVDTRQSWSRSRQM